jgi:hypothetical protein
VTDLDFVISACREARDNLPKDKNNSGDAIHALIIEVLGKVIADAEWKKRNP